MPLRQRTRFLFFSLRPSFPIPSMRPNCTLSSGLALAAAGVGCGLPAAAAGVLAAPVVAAGVAAGPGVAPPFLPAGDIHAADHHPTFAQLQRGRPKHCVNVQKAQGRAPFPGVFCPGIGDPSVSARLQIHGQAS